MAVLRSLAAVRAAPGLWWRAARASLGLQGRCLGRGYSVDAAQVRTPEFRRAGPQGWGWGRSRGEGGAAGRIAPGRGH